MSAILFSHVSACFLSIAEMGANAVLNIVHVPTGRLLAAGEVALGIGALVGGREVGGGTDVGKRAAVALGSAVG